jgi:hypothetical protein
MMRLPLSVTLLACAAIAVAAQDPAPPPASPAPPPVQAVQEKGRALVDSVRPFLVFVPKDEMWFAASSRGKRMVVDIGRVDLEIRRDSALALAYREAVAANSPVPVGSSFMLRAPWGSERVVASAVETWNGRVLLALEGSAELDSASSGTALVVASAELERPARGAPPAVPESMVPRTPPCDRTPVSGIYAERVKFVRDSLEAALRAQGMPIYDRLARRVTASSSSITGCFGPARVVLAVSLRANANEWTRQRVVVVDTLGAVNELVVQDFRFRVHDLLHALDADGDGVDDVAATGRTFLAGGTTILRYDPRARRLSRVAAGFSWESR